VLLAGCGQSPFPAKRQVPESPNAYRLGHLVVGRSAGGSFEAFLARLREHGYVEGQNLVVEVRLGNFDDSRLPGLATELVQLPVDVILAGGTPAHVAAARATGSIPIVTVVGDPTRDGLAASYARPGGNVTGFTTLEGTLGPKRLELLRDTVPTASRIAVLWNAGNSAKATEFTETQAAARVIGVEVFSLEIRGGDHLPRVYPPAGDGARTITPASLDRLQFVMGSGGLRLLAERGPVTRLACGPRPGARQKPDGHLV
jgi:putative ABC transport system substrate-binding protein